MPPCQVSKFNPRLLLLPVLLLSKLCSDAFEYSPCVICIESLFFFIITYNDSIVEWVPHYSVAVSRSTSLLYIFCPPSPFYSPLCCFPPGTGYLSFQQSSIWTRSWLTRSKTLKTSWLPRATSGRVSSLTSTACEWLGPPKAFVDGVNEWASVSVADYVSVPFYCLLSDIAELHYAGSLTSSSPP